MSSIKNAEATPRVAEILGIKAGQKFKIVMPASAYPRWYYSDEHGKITSVQEGFILDGSHLAYAIQHPECIVREDEDSGRAEPRLAEILRVKVGQKFKIMMPCERNTEWFEMDAYGRIFNSESGVSLDGMRLAYAIQFPDSVVRAKEEESPC